MNKKVSDLNEASYYTMYGAKYLYSKIRWLKPKRAKKKGIREMWIIYLEEVPDWAVKTWDSGEVYGSIGKFIRARNRLKKKIMKPY